MSLTMLKFRIHFQRHPNVGSRWYITRQNINWFDTSSFAAQAVGMKNVVALTFLPWILIVSCMSDDASLSPGELYQNHVDLLVSVEDYVNRPDKFVEGEWQEHWGDGALFGPLYDLAKHRFETASVGGVGGARKSLSWRI